MFAHKMDEELQVQSPTNSCSTAVLCYRHLSEYIYVNTNSVHFLLLKAYQYLREEVKTFQGKPIKVCYITER